MRLPSEWTKKCITGLKSVEKVQQSLEDSRVTNQVINLGEWTKDFESVHSPSRLMAPSWYKGEESTGKEYTRSVQIELVRGSACLYISYRACAVWARGTLSLIQSHKNLGFSKLLKRSQSPVACLLVSSAEAVQQGSPVLVAWGRTGFKCVFSGGGSFARARERSGLHRPLSPSRCLWLKLLCQWNTAKKLPKASTLTTARK